jgi:hypothetical protein
LIRILSILTKPPAPFAPSKITFQTNDGSLSNIRYVAFDRRLANLALCRVE